MIAAREETKAVKLALIDAGFDKAAVKVGHGRGTARAWLEIHVNHIDGLTFSQNDDLAVKVAQKATGRHGDYQGRISVDIEREEVA